MAPQKSSNTKTSIQLYNGEYFDYLEPDYAVIDLDVLERGLQQLRFNSQTIRPITIAEHSLRVWRFVRELGGNQATQLEALLHDSPETVVPWGDCLRPGKTDEMRNIEMSVRVAIDDALGCPISWSRREDAVDPPLVKLADNIALYFEAMLWLPGAIGWAPAIITSGQTIERFLPLVAPRPGESWRAEVEELLKSGSAGRPDR